MCWLAGESDPYVKVHIANRSVLAKTRVIECTYVDGRVVSRGDNAHGYVCCSKDPTWDETAFVLLHSLEETLSFDVMDSGNNIKRDTMLGVVQLELKSLEAEPEREDM
jgi:Ca2+-dependent lipid-binding protein